VDEMNKLIFLLLIVPAVVSAQQAPAKPVTSPPVTTTTVAPRGAPTARPPQPAANLQPAAPSKPAATPNPTAVSQPAATNQPAASLQPDTVTPQSEIVSPPPATPGTPIANPTSATAPAAGHPAQPHNSKIAQEMNLTFRSCFLEIQKYCKKEEDDFAPLRNCLSSHVSTIKGLCLRHVQSYGQAFVERLKKACIKEIAASCSSIQPGQGKLTKCLKSAPPLSQTCPDILKSL
jgi:hypothetical protein